MKGRLLALTVGMLLVLAVPAAADTSSFGGQSADQSPGNMQSATSGATSTQYAPSNENISVRVLSPGDNGDVSQSNNSSAESFAGNANFTHQTIEQSQPGTGGCCEGPIVLSRTPCCQSGHSLGIQAAGQQAFNQQGATSTATSEQFMPQNFNKSLRIKDGKRPAKECGCAPPPPKGCGCQPRTPKESCCDPQDPKGNPYGSAPKHDTSLMPVPADDSAGKRVPAEQLAGQVEGPESQRPLAGPVPVAGRW